MYLKYGRVDSFRGIEMYRIKREMDERYIGLLRYR